MKQSTLHVAIIMDGNGRWAERLGLPRLAGHRRGADALRRVVEAAPGAGIRILTVYAFSSDNWKRPRPEVDGLFSLFDEYLCREIEECVRNCVRLTVIGRRDRLSAQLRARIATAEDATRDGAALHLRIAVDYSARDLLLRAAAEPGAAGSRVTFADALGRAQGGSPARDVDLLIRTGGEQRLSDFLLWECAYAEFVFVPILWPDFNSEHLRACVDDFHKRHRRFGAIMQGNSQLIPHA